MPKTFVNICTYYKHLIRENKCKMKDRRNGTILNYHDIPIVHRKIEASKCLRYLIPLDKLKSTNWCIVV